MMKIVIHNAQNSDGKVLPLNIDSDFGHTLVPQFGEDIVLCGSGTILKRKLEFDRLLNYRIPEPKPDDPRLSLAVIDSMARVNCWMALAETGRWKEFYALVSKNTNKAYISNLIRLGVQPIMTGDDKIDIGKSMAVLGTDFGHKVCRIDSGGTLNNILLELDLVDELSLIIYPVIPGSEIDVSSVSKNIVNMKLVEIKPMGNGVMWLKFEKRLSGKA